MTRIDESRAHRHAPPEAQPLHLLGDFVNDLSSYLPTPFDLHHPDSAPRLDQKVDLAAFAARMRGTAVRRGGNKKRPIQTQPPQESGNVVQHKALKLKSKYRLPSWQLLQVGETEKPFSRYAILGVKCAFADFTPIFRHAILGVKCAFADFTPNLYPALLVVSG